MASGPPISPISSITLHSRKRGRLIPRRARGLRAGAVILKPGESVAWHSTRRREELITILAGRLSLEFLAARRRVRCLPLRSGQCAFVRAHTIHRMVNASRATARYMYVTGPA